MRFLQAPPLRLGTPDLSPQGVPRPAPSAGAGRRRGSMVAMAPTRTRYVPCPHCGEPVQVGEVGITVAELHEPVAWRVTKVLNPCQGGCPMKADDFR